MEEIGSFALYVLVSIATAIVLVATISTIAIMLYRVWESKNSRSYQLQEPRFRVLATSAASFWVYEEMRRDGALHVDADRFGEYSRLAYPDGIDMDIDTMFVAYPRMWNQDVIRGLEMTSVDDVEEREAA